MGQNSYGKGGSNVPAPDYNSAAAAQGGGGMGGGGMGAMGGGGSKGGGNVNAPAYANQAQSQYQQAQGVMGGGGGKGTGNVNAPFYDKLAAFADQGGGAGAGQQYQRRVAPQYSLQDMQQQAQQGVQQAGQQQTQQPQQGPLTDANYRQRMEAQMTPQDRSMRDAMVQYQQANPQLQQLSPQLFGQQMPQQDQQAAKQQAQAQALRDQGPAPAAVQEQGRGLGRLLSQQQGAQATPFIAGGAPAIAQPPSDGGSGRALIRPAAPAAAAPPPPPAEGSGRSLGRPRSVAPPPPPPPVTGYQGATPVNNFAAPTSTNDAMRAAANAAGANMDFSGFEGMSLQDMNRQINNYNVGGADYDPTEQARLRRIAENTPGSKFFNPNKFGGGLKTEADMQQALQEANMMRGGR